MRNSQQFRRGGSRFDRLSAGVRRQRGEMNTTERKWAEELTADPSVYAWWFEPLSLRLTHPESGQPARLTPDFLVLYDDGTTCLDDVKGNPKFADAASGVRMKCAAELFPLWKFRIVSPKRKRDGGGWQITEV